MVYLDTAASYPLLPEVKTALAEAFEIHFANSASSHLLGAQVSEEIELARKVIADQIGAFQSEVIFTSGATESNNIAFKSLLLGGDIPTYKKHIITSLIEHKCIFSITDYFKKLGYDITYLKPDENGLIQADAVRKSLRDDTALVSIMHVNNELGSINPISEIGEVCFENNVLFHSDAAQSFCKQEIDVDELNVDVLSLSAHKIGGPKGIGAVYIRDLRKRNLQPVIHGAGQESGIRGGTVAAPLILGFKAAVESFPKHYESLKQLNIKEHLLNELSNNSIPFIENAGLHSLDSCISITLPSTNTALLLREYENSLCLAQGSACSSKEIEASHVLLALGLDRELADKTFRISFPLDVKPDDISLLVNAIKKATE